MAPELFSATPQPTLASDVYAFGMTLYEVVTQTLPFEEQSDYTIAYAIMTGLRPHRPTLVSDELWKLLLDCWDEDPAVRPTMEQVIRRLDALISTERPSLYQIATREVQFAAAAWPEIVPIGLVTLDVIMSALLWVVILQPIFSLLASA